ncbi:MAG: OmpA family protein [Longimicrobiales bacterium]
MSTRALWSMIFALILLMPLQAAAQRLKPADRGTWELVGFAGAFDDDPEFDPDGRAQFVNPAGNVLFGAGLNYHFPIGFFIGAEGRFIPLEIQPQRTDAVDLNTLLYSGVVGYTIPLHANLDIYGVGGASGVYWNTSDEGSQTDFAFNYGGGIKVYLTDQLALTADYRMFQIPSALQTITENIIGVTPDETFWGYSITGGISYVFPAKDSDGDGVKDRDDACPGTPPGVEVDAVGCPLDSDGDGVPDYLDQCPNTPAGAVVDSQGCPLDSDGDGVFDGLDRCPDTPAGATVDQYGCPMDSDGDGVYDGLDRCPNTPMGTEVDEYGCPLPEPEPAVPAVFMLSGSQGGVNFAFDSDQLTARGEEGLREIGRTLVQAENLGRITIEGHTDSQGAEEYNQDLSRRRAESVRAFLVASFPQLANTEFTVVGMGESEPIATNDTPEGRAQNRRVEIIVGG